MNPSAADRRLLFVCPGLLRRGESCWGRQTLLIYNSMRPGRRWRLCDEKLSSLLLEDWIWFRRQWNSQPSWEKLRCNQGNRPEIEINHTVQNNCKKWDSKSKQGRRWNNLETICQWSRDSAVVMVANDLMVLRGSGESRWT